MNEIIAYIILALVLAIAILSLMLDMSRKEVRYLQERNYELQRKVSEQYRIIESIKPPIIDERV